MKISLDWLGQYIDLTGLSYDDIAHKLTMTTAEVDGVETLVRSVEGIKVGEITSIEPIDTAESEKFMNYVTVNLGTETCKTVCGAPNVMVGMKSAFAVPGTLIADGLTVREQKVYNKVSCGILCSPWELRWGESHAGILAFPDTLAAGTELADLVPPVDHIIDIDNKSITHRPDLWGFYGFARELAAIYKRELIPLDIADASDWDNHEKFPLSIEDFEGCPGYCCIDIDNLTPGFSPIELQYRLLTVGLRPINLLVDLTNYLMCELGQPMHAFDGDRVREIIVAPFGSTGTFSTLDGIKRTMIPEDLMINDNSGPIALAGIMGGENSEIGDETTRVLLESANFNPSRIRRTSVRLGLRTDASLRFEKGQPPYNMALSIKRFVRLLHEAGKKPYIRSRLTCEGDTGEKLRRITMKTEYVSRTIGMKISDGAILKILNSLGFGCELENNELKVNIPAHRSARDISIPNDIVEEVARIYGYDNITPSMPEIELGDYNFNTGLLQQHKIRRFLSTAREFNEVHTYSWYDDVWLRRIGYNPDETLRIKNQASEYNTRMRLEILPNLLTLIESNAMHRDRFFLYELGNVFRPTIDGCEQSMNLAGIGYQSEKLGNLQELFLSMKGTLEELFVLLDAGIPLFSESTDNSLVAQQRSEKPWCSPGNCMDISLNDEHIGKFGCLTRTAKTEQAGKISEVFEKDTQVIWFELSLDKLSGNVYPIVSYNEIPVFPGSWMDFSILADKTSQYADLAETLDRFSHSILKNRKFLYSYSGKELPEGKASYTFRFWLGLKERTLTGKNLSGFRGAFLTFLEKNRLSLR